MVAPGGRFPRPPGATGLSPGSWDRPITDDLYALLKPLPAELFQQG
ncbi:hypothetical protein RB199_37995 [Streptomyces libani]